MEYTGWFFQDWAVSNLENYDIPLTATVMQLNEPNWEGEFWAEHCNRNESNPISSYELDKKYWEL